MLARIKKINWKITSIILLVTALIAYALTTIFFRDLAPGEFLYIADQFFKLSFRETLADSFFKRRLDNLSQHNSYTMILGFWDLLFMIGSYLAGLNFLQTEKLIFFITLWMSQVLAFYGFREINKELETKAPTIGLGAITLWYCFNPYTLALWHGGVYNITAGLTYSLLPIAFVLIYRTFTKDFNLKNILISGMILHIMTYTFWLFAVVILLLSVFFIYLGWKSPDKKVFASNILKRVILLGFIYLLLSAFIYVNIFDEFFTTGGNNNDTFSRNFENLQGGLLYPILLIFSWGIYTKWVPRTIYSFGDYFFSGLYYTSIAWLYFLGGIGLFYKFKNKEVSSKTKLLIWGILVGFISTVFLAKGSQKPFGFIFTLLYDYIPFFKIFKSPELRFGFAIVFCISVILILAAEQLNKYLFTFSLITLMLIQNIYFFNGIAVRGEYIPEQYYDRIVKFSDDQKQLISYLNENNTPGDGRDFGYILPTPSVEYGFFEFDGDPYIGPDLVQKETEIPFVYVSGYGGISTATYEKLFADFEDGSLEELRDFPIKYILFRKDTSCNGCPTLNEEFAEQNLQLKLENGTYKLYEVPESTKLVQIENVDNYDVKVLSPVKILVSLKNISQENFKLKYLTSFNEGWKIYSEGNYLGASTIAEGTHRVTNGYANEWTISIDEIKNLGDEHFVENEDGTIDVNLVIYYKAQNALYISAIVSLMGFIGVVTVLIWHKND